MDDGKVEVIAFGSSWALARGQLGVGHAIRICQVCSLFIGGYFQRGIYHWLNFLGNGRCDSHKAAFADAS